MAQVTQQIPVLVEGDAPSANVCEGQSEASAAPNASVSSSVPSVSVVTSLSTPIVSISAANTQNAQLIVSSSQQQLAPNGTAQTHNGLIGQTLGPTITSVANQTVQMAAQTQQQNQIQPLLQTSVQPTANQMSVTMSPLPQVQVIQQPLGTATGTYQLQQVYPQGMLLPGNLTLQNMSFGAPNQGLSLQIPFSGTGGVSTGTMPITSIAAKPPIMSKVAISPLAQHQHMISPLKPNMAGAGTQILKPMLPGQQFAVPHSAANQTVVISQLLPQSQHSVQQSILPANANKTLLEAPKGKPFGTGSVRSPFGNKMLSHSGAIQPKSHILPATSMSSQFLANSQFKTHFTPTQNTTQLIAAQSPNNLIQNQQILGSFQTIGPGLNWTSPQSTHLVASNGQPIFIRGPTQSGEHIFFSTANMNSPQIQAVSMPTPISVHNSTPTSMQMSAVTTQSSQMVSTPINPPPQPMPMPANSMPMTTTAVSSSQPTTVAPTPVTPTNATKSKRQSSSVSTQTSAQTQTQTVTQKVESTSNLKPIAPAKPKHSAQHSANKSSKDSHTATPASRSTGVGTAQTVQPTASPSIPAKSQSQSSKSDAGNQTVKISVATETAKNQVTSSRTTGDQNKQTTTKSNNTSNTGTETTEPKVNSSSEQPRKSSLKKSVVEKKDAATEQDSEMSTNFFAQNHHKSNKSLVQTNNVSNSLAQVNGQIPVLSDLNRQDISKPPQKAIVKPQKSQILTHVIDGYIIQESANPFPVNGVGYSSESRATDGMDAIETLKTKNKNENSMNSNASSSKNRTNSERHPCLSCGGKRKANSKGGRHLKKFCSQTCSDKYKNQIPMIGSRLNNSEHNGLVIHNSVTGHLDNSDLQRPVAMPNAVKPETNLTPNENSCHRMGPTTSEAPPMVNPVAPTISTSDESSNATNPAIAGLYIPPGGRNPLQWSVNDVYEFVRNLQGCTEFADEFRSQEIDGQALMLIKEDHLMNTMNMKLGPALKICSKINALREDAARQS